MRKQIPNILTIIRFILIFFIVIALKSSNYITGLILFTISGITDVVDGYLARKLDAISNFGKLMDPLADKLTQLATLTVLAVEHVIPYWILSIFVIKEFILIIGAAFLYGKDVVVYSRWYGKFATCSLYVAVVTSIILKQFNVLEKYIVIQDIIYLIAIISTCISLILYTKDLLKKGIIEKADITKPVNEVSLKNDKNP